MGNPQAVGLSLGVYHHGEAYDYHYGEIEKGSGKLPHAHTLYPIASITKTFTATLLAQAVIDGKVHLDDDIRHYLDNTLPNLEYQGAPVRLKDLLNHRSGLPFLLPDIPDVLPGFNNDIVSWSTRVATVLQHYTMDEFFADLGTITLVSVPGTEFRYSNAAAQLAGYILERLYGKPYEVLLREKILQQLSANDTSIHLPLSEQSRLVKGYDETGMIMPYLPDQLQAAGALKSTTSDMLKYVQWHVAETDAAVRLTHQPTWSHESGYAAGLNWQMLTSKEGYRTIWQDGSFPGFYNLCVFSPELDIGVVVLSNQADRWVGQRTTVMANHILTALDARTVSLPGA
jgi:serine-type D-Ala-D-Ala carboxypeptidase/endopeptidase